MTVTDHILSATDRGEVSLLCLIDLSKCFDLINHDILLRKMCWYGIAAYLCGHRDQPGTGQAS